MSTAKDRQKCEKIYQKHYRGRMFHDMVYGELIRKYLVSGQKALDAGCGRYMRFCKNRSDAAAVGIDLETTLEADNRAASFGVWADVSRLPFLDGHFDM